MGTKRVPKLSREIKRKVVIKNERQWFKRSHKMSSSVYLPMNPCLTYFRVESTVEDIEDELGKVNRYCIANVLKRTFLDKIYDR